MTKYRTVSNGYFEYLQYLSEERFCWFLWKRLVWRYIWRPYYHDIWGRNGLLVQYPDADVCISSLNENLKDFVREWENISDYFKWANEEQNRLISSANKRNEKIEEKKRKVEYF